VADWERVKGIEPSCVAWEATVLPLNYTRGCFVNGGRSRRPDSVSVTFLNKDASRTLMGHKEQRGRAKHLVARQQNDV
jgi:hypothetical protein